MRCDAARRRRLRVSFGGWIEGCFANCIAFCLGKMRKTVRLMIARDGN